MEFVSSDLQLVTCRDGNKDNRLNRTGAPRLDLAFELAEMTGLNLHVPNNRDDVIEFLEHAIARDPGDLRSHVRRINIYNNYFRNHAVFGALVDLFLVLRQRGLALRKHMLAYSRRYLDETHYVYLKQHLAGGLYPHDALPKVRNSVLAMGVAGHHCVVRKLDDGSSHEQDPLEAARSHIEFSQVDEAQQLLERAILAEPSRFELHFELIDIYRLTRAGASFRRMQEKLEAIAVPLPDAWAELEVLFEGSV